MEELFHVTVLSNLSRAYDKYGRRYDKSRIPESTFPERFFLLTKDELGIGIEKATRLLRKRELPGDRLIVLHTRVHSEELHENTRTGLGRFIERASVPLEGVSFVDADERLEPVVLEHAMALSHRVAQLGSVRFDELVPRSVSLLPVARACQAKCPFCFSKASVSADVAAEAPDWARIAEVLSAAKLRGAERAVITGGGEPTLVGTEALERMVALGRAEFSKVVLITNGAVWGRLAADVCEQRLDRLAAAGLTVVALSRHHFDAGRNAQLMGIDTRSEQVAAAVARLRRTHPGLRLRIICVLQRGGVDDEASLSRYIDVAAALGVDEICFKELYVSTSVDSEYHDREANDWSHQNQVPLRLVVEHAANAGWSIVERLPWGAPVFEGAHSGRRLRVAAYTEPSLSWELANGICRSWNLMADGRCLASLEDKQSEVMKRGLRKLPTLS